MTPQARGRKGSMFKIDTDHGETTGFVLFSKRMVGSHSSGLRANHSKTGEALPEHHAKLATVSLPVALCTL